VDFQAVTATGLTDHQVLGTCGTATTLSLCPLVAGDLPLIPLTTGVTGVLPSANGGTSVNNGSSTITIGGNLTFSGAYTFTGTLTANTAVTFPTTGTLCTTATCLTSGANAALSNLAAVAVNAALTPGTDASIALDSLSKRYTNGWFSGVLGWTNGSGTATTGLSQDSAGVVDVGNGTAGDKSAQINANIHSSAVSGSAATPECLDSGSNLVKSCIAFGENAGNTPVPQAGLDMLWSSFSSNALMYSHNGQAFVALNTGGGGGGGGGSGTVGNCSLAYALAFYAATGTVVNCTNVVSDSTGNNLIVPGYQKVGSALTQGTITIGKLACMTASNTIGNCTGTPSNNFVGVFTTTDGFYSQLGSVPVTLDTSTSVAYGDILCASSTSAGTAHDNGSTACTVGQWVGIIQTTASSVTTAQALLRLE
jgi:hypothetical protein